MDSRKSTGIASSGPTPKPGANGHLPTPSLATKPVIAAYPAVPQKAKTPPPSSGSSLRYVNPPTSTSTHFAKPGTVAGTAPATPKSGGSGSVEPRSKSPVPMKTTTAVEKASATSAPKPTITPVAHRIPKPQPSILEVKQSSMKPTTSSSGTHTESDTGSHAPVPSKASQAASASKSLDNGLGNLAKGPAADASLPVETSLSDLTTPRKNRNDAHVILGQRNIDRSAFTDLDPDVTVVPPQKPVPEPGDWIIFHAEHGYTVKIGWWKTFSVWEEAEYYRVPCYWSACADFTTHAPQRSLLFVAKEWMDPRFIVPAATELSFLYSHHVRSSRLFQNVGESGAWVKARLDHHFFYGQDSAEDPQERWMVYHPVERNPFQGRFVKSFKQRVFENITSHIPSIADPYGLASGGLNNTTPEKVSSVMLTIDGDPLHRFQLPDDPEYIANVRTAQTTLVQHMQNMLREVGIDHASTGADAESPNAEAAETALHESRQTLIVALQGLKALEG